MPLSGSAKFPAETSSVIPKSSSPQSGSPHKLTDPHAGVPQLKRDPLSPRFTERFPWSSDWDSFTGVSNLAINHSSPLRRRLPWVPTSGTWVLLPANQAALTCIQAFGHCSPPAAVSVLPPSRARRALGLGLLVSPTSPRSSSDLGTVSCVPQIHSARQCVRQDVGRASPASRKTTGHCPQFPPNLGIVPGSSNGLGVAPGHCGLPPGSRSPSARPPPAAERSLSVSRLPARLGTQPPGLQPCGELPVASRVPARLPNPLAAVPLGLALASGDCRGHGSGAREPAAGQPVGRAARPETRAAFVCSLQRSQPWGKRLGGPQAGQAGRWEGGTRGRGAPRWGGAARRLQPPGGGSREARAERGRSD